MLTAEETEAQRGDCTLETQWKSQGRGRGFGKLLACVSQAGFTVTTKWAPIPGSPFSSFDGESTGAQDGQGRGESSQNPLLLCDSEKVAYSSLNVYLHFFYNRA